MNSYCMIYELKKEYVSDYVEIHKNCWFEQLRALKDSGTENLQIFMYENYSIIYYECEDFDHWLENLAKTESNKKWQEIIGKWFVDSPVLEGKNKIKTLEKIFDLKRQIEYMQANKT